LEYNIQECCDCIHEEMCMYKDNYKQYIERIMSYDIEDENEIFKCDYSINCKYFSC
jgi:hypothetical protein